MDTKEKGLFQDATGNFFFLLIQKVSKRKPILDIHVLQLFYLAVTLKANHLQGEKNATRKPTSQVISVRNFPKSANTKERHVKESR